MRIMLAALALFAFGQPAIAQDLNRPYVHAALELMNPRSCPGATAGKAHESLPHRFEAAKARAVRRGGAALMREGDRRLISILRRTLFDLCPEGAERSGLRAEKAVAAFERIWPA